MEYKHFYRFSKNAMADLGGIVSYISPKLLNPNAASSFADSLNSSIEELCLFHRSGSLVDNKFIPNAEVRKK